MAGEASRSRTGALSFLGELSGISLSVAGLSLPGVELLGVAQQRRQVLVVDDDPSVRDLMVMALHSGGYDTLEAGSSEEADLILRSSDVSLVLLDNNLPGLSGSDFVRNLRAEEATERLPVVIVSSAGRADRKAAGLRAGADDYLVKPVRIRELLARVDAHLRREAAWNEAVERRHRRREARMRSLYSIEPGEPRQIADKFCDVLAEDHSGVGLIAFVGEGEAILLGVRQLRLSTAVASPPPGAVRDMCARASRGPWIGHLQGDEFGPFAELGRLACAPMHAGSDVIGLLVLSVERSDRELDPPDAAAVLGEAIDYAAIAANLFGPQLPELGRRGIRQSEMGLILSERRFDPVFQAIIHLNSGREIGFEALTRFHNGLRPDLVFAEAASLGLGVELELATLGSIFTAAKFLPTGVWVSVNVSPSTLCDERLPSLLQGIEREVVLELTEHDRIDDYMAVRRSMEALPSEVRLSVDDAGAGFASLQHVLELEPDYIKLDRSWVTGIDNDLARQALVAGLGHFSDRVGCRMIAEGIETDGELMTLRELAAPLGQGFLFGQPARIDLNS